MNTARIRSWLFDTAFPFWADVGVDREGPGFVEHLTVSGRPADVGFKRVRVQARQVYCFAQAHELGWTGNALDVAARGVTLLLDRAWLGADRGWASVLSRSGEAIDLTPDLYDIAFVLFALGWWLRASGDDRVIPVALGTLDFLDRSMRHATGEGYLHRKDGTEPHLQNPHMHLLEAVIVLRDATGHPRFVEEADRLLGLCVRRFYDPASATLAETFTDMWDRLPGPTGLLLEPGHHYEWVWLLDQAQRGRPRPGTGDVGPAMRALFDFAARSGQDSSGLVVESVTPGGVVVGSDHRLWPQLERLKAWIAMASRHGVAATGPVANGVDLVFRHYLATDPPGTWIETRDSALRPKADKIPASSFYHVVLAFAEVLRFEEQQGPVS